MPYLDVVSLIDDIFARFVSIIVNYFQFVNLHEFYNNNFITFITYFAPTTSF